MGLQNILTNVFLTASDADPKMSDVSFVPFLGFLMFVFGIVFVFIGIVIVISARREWKIYYHPHDEYTEETKKKRKNEMLKGRILYITGIILFILSYVVL